MESIDELITKLAQDTETVKRAPHPFMLSIEWMTVAVLYLAVALMISDVRQDLLVALHNFWFAAEIAALVGIFISTSVSAALLSYPDLHQKHRIVFAPLVAFALFVVVMLLAWQADNPSSPLPIHSFQCTLSITMVSLLPAGWIFYVMQKFASTHSRWAGGIAVMFSFSIGALWLRLFEQTDSITHVIEWHYVPMIAFGVIGMWLGKRILKW
ncbi:MAG: DUF1109 domain-containing protein [Gallionella sp.]|jgi:hypothetical protein